MAGEAKRSGAMLVVTNRVRHGDREYSSTLLRRLYREGGKVKKETLANLSRLPPELIELIRGALRGQRYLPAGEAFVIERSLPAGTCRRPVRWRAGSSWRGFWTGSRRGSATSAWR